jgi:hypothetical protein
VDGHANETITRTIYIHLFKDDSAKYTALFDMPEASAATTTNVRELRGTHTG